MTLGYFDRFFRAISSVGILLIYLPILNLVGSAFFSPSYDDPTVKEFSLRAFQAALSHEELRSSLYMSTQLAFLTSLTVLFIVILLALGLQGKSKDYLHFFRNLFSLPLMLPEIIIGLSLLIWFVFIHITLGTISLWIAHVTFTLPYAIILVTLGLESIEKGLYEAGRDLGATKFEIFKRITLPLLKPSLISTFLLSFVISFDDFLISYFTNGPGNDTLPVKLYSLMRFGISSELKAISTLILGVSFLITIVLFKFLPKKSNHKEI